MITLRGAATPVLPPFQVPGQWGHLADGRSHPAGAPALRPRRDGAVPSTPACSVNCSLRPLRPSAREHADTSAGRRETRPAQLRLPLQRGQQELSPMPPAPRAHARVHCARLTAEAALSKTRPPKDSRLNDQPFRHSLALWGPPASWAPHTSQHCAVSPSAVPPATQTWLGTPAF